MILGVDFDNTLVSYDEIFYTAALEGGLVPATLPPSKNHVRAFLRTAGREHLWTELQGYVYGEAIKDAPPFPGAVEALAALLERGADVRIISHKTRRPYLGNERYDLHEAARCWIEANILPRILRPVEAYFETTKEAKLERIAATNCTHFVDDLPEFLGEHAFPAGVVKILFDPAVCHEAAPDMRKASSWREIHDILEKELPPRDGRAP